MGNMYVRPTLDNSEFSFLSNYRLLRARFRTVTGPDLMHMLVAYELYHTMPVNCLLLLICTHACSSVTHHPFCLLCDESSFPPKTVQIVILQGCLCLFLHLCRFSTLKSWHRTGDLSKLFFRPLPLLKLCWRKSHIRGTPRRISWWISRAFNVSNPFLFVFVTRKCLQNFSPCWTLWSTLPH